MNKEDFLVVLQCALFSFGGSNEQEIQELNSYFDLKLIRVGVKIAEDLKLIELGETK